MMAMVMAPDPGSLTRYTLDIFGILGGISSAIFYFATVQIKDKLDLKIERASITVADRLRKTQDKNVIKIAILEARMNQIEKMTGCEVTQAFKEIENSVDEDISLDTNFS